VSPRATTHREAATQVAAVSPERLAPGRWCHARDRQIGQGDIRASYSADVIAMEGRVRKPFHFQGWLWIAVAFRGAEAEAYRLIPAHAFEGTPVSYAAKVLPEGGELARNDPSGFYHGMEVRSGKEAFVLAGPALRLVPDAQAPVQTDLFGGEGGAP